MTRWVWPQLDDEPWLMGILNATPDSFSDGGLHQSLDDALAAATHMIEQGAHCIDVGGESTRPGALHVDEAEQIRRTVPVILALRKAHPEVATSIDTTRSAVASAALDAGAVIINDVSAALDDPLMMPLAASRQCGLILMHRLKPPVGDSYSHQYRREPDYRGDVVGVVCEFLRSRSEAALAAGVDRRAIAIDPGLGFGKTVDQNYELIRRSDAIAELGYPVLSAGSRKSFIGAVAGVEKPSDRLAGSLAVSVAHYLAGARVFRVHDVAAHRQALAVAAQIVESRAIRAGVAASS